jgi:hypothetical protein
VTDNRSDISDVGYGEVILYLLQCVRTRFRMCAHARWSCGSLCFTAVKEA